MMVNGERGARPSRTRPCISVGIPTRDRLDTLRACLATCVDQNASDVEFVVSDNASTDGTRDFVEAASRGDSRVRYVNTGARVSMSENFEFALSHMRGEFVMFIGDDDALLPDALRRVRLDVDLRHTDALVWQSQHYYWPGFFDEQLANMLSMALRQPRRVQVVDSATMLREVSRFERRYNFLPSPYFGLVRRSVLERARGAENGRFFNSITPDVYAGVAVASVLPSYQLSSRAYTLSGQSKHSQGSSQMTGRGQTDPHSESARFLQENTLPFHRDIAYAPSIPVLVTEALLQVREHVPRARTPAPDVAAMISAAVRDPEFLFNRSVQGTVLSALEVTVQRHGPAIQDHLAREVRSLQQRRHLRAIREAARLVFAGHLLVDCGPHGVTDVRGAAELHERLLLENSGRAARTVSVARARLGKARRVGVAGLRQLRRDRPPSGDQSRNDKDRDVRSLS